LKRTTKTQSNTLQNLILLKTEIFCGYLGNIDAYEYIADSQIELQDPSKKRRRGYKVFEMTPIGEGNPSVRQDEQIGQRYADRNEDRRRIELDETQMLREMT
jgi:hypothetical protein